MTKLLRIPLRGKIVALVSAALALSLTSYLLIGTSLIRDDKLSYIYAYNQEQVRASADAVDSQIQRVTSTASLLGRLISRPLPEKQEQLIQNAFKEAATRNGMTALLFLRPIGADKFGVELKYGELAEQAELSLARLGWTPSTFKKASIQVGTDPDKGQLLVGGTTNDSGDGPLVFLTLITPSKDLFRTAGAGFQSYVIDKQGVPIGPAPNDLEDVSTLSRSLLSEGFPSGARDGVLGKTPYVVSYQRAGFGSLLVLGLISKSLAFAASRALVMRTIFLGLGIFLVVFGGTMLFVRTVTLRLKAVWLATRKVSEGDFSVRIDTSKVVEDEIQGLSNSFNKMADKIGDLMIQTAQKARMEKELETAKVVQALYFPNRPFEHPTLHLAGTCVPASECSGDWWHYAQLGERLVVVVGDVTGHGVSAALVTAAAHAAFSNWRKNAEEDVKPSDPVPLHTLVDSLNSAVIAAGGGKSNMTMVASVIDMKASMLYWVNAAHPAPYLYRPPAEGSKPAAGNPLKPIMGSSVFSALGSKPKHESKLDSIPLLPGDRIFWYTDGLLENRASDQKKMSKPTLLKKMASFCEARSADADVICRSVIDDAIAFFGSNAEERPDDITVIVGAMQVRQESAVMLPGPDRVGLTP